MTAAATTTISIVCSPKQLSDLTGGKARCIACRESHECYWPPDARRPRYA